MLAAWLVAGAPPPRERSTPLRPAAISLFADPQQSARLPEQRHSAALQDAPPVTKKPHNAPHVMAGGGKKPALVSATPPPQKNEWISHWTLHMLSEVYKHGVASNDVSQAGLMIHAFDDTEDWYDHWTPCSKDGWCEQFNKHWSASIVNAKQPNTWTSSGILLHPDTSMNQILCAGAVDIATYNSGCRRPNTNDKVYQPNELKDMLNASMNNCGARCQDYNEVVINSTYYVQHLPHSILAIVYFNDAAAEEQMKATETYVALLDKFHLTECALPLLKIVRGETSLKRVVIDMSASARANLDSHSFDRFRDRHPLLKLPASRPGHRTRENVPFEEAAPLDRHGCHLDDIPPSSPPPSPPPFGVAATPIPNPNADPTLRPATPQDVSPLPSPPPSPPMPPPLAPLPMPPAPPMSPSPAPPRVSIEGLESMFAHARPANGVGKVGVIFHAFDDTEDYRELWKPCTAGWCVRFTSFWSTSIINAKQRNSFASSGILLAPHSNEVLCSWPEDMAQQHGATNVDTSCDTRFADGAVPYPREQLKDMLEISMGGSETYNEVIVDSQVYMKNLPNSIAAVAYYDDSSEEEQIKATETYLAMLQAYDLTVDDIPLVKIIREPAYGQPFIEDASAGAETFLSEQRYQRFRREHPKLRLPPHQRAALSPALHGPNTDEPLVTKSSFRSHLASYAAEANLERAVAAASSKAGAAVPPVRW